MFLAQVAAGWSLGNIFIAMIILLALCAIVYVASQAMGVPIPQWLIRIVAIVIIACVAILAIRFVLSM